MGTAEALVSPGPRGARSLVSHARGTDRATLETPFLWRDRVATFVNPTARALMDSPDAELARIAIDDMAIYLPDLESRTQAVTVVRRPLAVPAYKTGSFAKIAEFRAAVRSVPNLFLVGDYLRSPLVESAVRSALDVVATS